MKNKLSAISYQPSAKSRFVFWYMVNSLWLVKHVFLKLVSTIYHLPSTIYKLEFFRCLSALFLRIGRYPYLLQQYSYHYEITQEGFIKLTKHAVVSYLILFFVISGTGLIYLFNPFGTKEAEAAWFNDNWAYRKRIDLTIASSGSDITNLDTLITIDTTGITSKIQSSCQDFRFTNAAGKLLPYYIDTCNTNSATATKVWVKADLVPKNTTTYTLYFYYGNPAASSATDSVTFNLYNGLKGYWTMNESSWTANCTTGGSVIDSSVNGNNGRSCPTTTGSTTPLTGQYGNAGNFDGSNDFVDVFSPNLPTGDFTYSAWVNMDTANSSDAILVADSSTTVDQDEFSLLARGDAGQHFELNLNGGGSATAMTSAFTYATSTWYNVVVTRSGSNVLMYINNSVDANTLTEGDTLNFSTCSLIIGGDETARCNTTTPTIAAQFDGKIDDVRIYNRALSATEVSQLYNSPGTITTTATGTSKPTSSFASEEKAPTAIAYWKFDDPAVSNVIQDATTNNNDGTLSGTTKPAWQSEDQCITGKCYFYDGSTSYVTAGTGSSVRITGALTLSAWIRLTTNNAKHDIIVKNGTSVASTSGLGYALYTDSSGKLNMDISSAGTSATTKTATGATTLTANQWYFVQGVYSPSTSITVYVNGVQDGQNTSSISSAINDNSAKNVEVGSENGGSTNYMKGFIDEAKIYNQSLSSSQIKSDYNSRSNPEGLSEQAGSNIQNMSSVLSSGLAGYWKMDESSGNAADSSGNSTTLTNNNTVAYASGKFGRAASYTAASSMYHSTATTISGIQTVSFWTNNASTSDEYLNLTASTYITSSSGTVSATGFTNPTVYVNGVINGTLIASAWNLVVITSDTGINANQFEVGRGNGSYNNGKIDEVRTYNRILSSADVSQLYNWAAGPVGYWKMDEGSWNGTSGEVKDSSGNGSNGTATNGPTTSTGKYGKAGSFTGTSSQYVDLSNPSVLNITGPITLSAWVTVSSTSGTGAILARSANSTSTIQYEFRRNNKDIELLISNGTTTFTGQYSNALAAADTWYFVTGTFDGTTIQIYVNGVPSTTTATFTGTQSTTTTQYIGRRGSGSSLFFTGRIDEAKIYNYRRTQAQIIEDMNAGHPAPGSPVGTPLGYWKLDEGYGTTVNNSGSTGSSAAGTITGSPSWTDAGQNGKALVFDGTNNKYVSIPGSGSLLDVTDGSFTMTAWAKPTSLPANTNNSNSAAVILGRAGFHTYIGYDPNQKFTMDMWNNSSSNFRAVSSTAYPVGSWHHVAGVVNTTDSTVKVYVDGILQNSSAFSGSPMDYAGTANYFLGKVTTSTCATNFSWCFTGSIDDAKIYASALTPSQIALDMNRGSAQILGATSNNSSYQPQAANQEYCLPGDTTSCAAPVARWDFEEGSGTTAQDSSGNANTGTLTSSPVYSVGKVGKAVTFNGSSSYVTAADSTSLSPTAAITVEGWYKSTALGVSNTFISKWGATSAWDLQTFSADSSILFVFINGLTDYGFTPSGTWTTGWHHIAFTYQANGSTAANQLKLYVDGQAVALTYSGASLPSSLNDTNTAVTIGTIAASSNWFNGSADNVRIFNYARTPAQIAWDYNKGGSVAWWKMDECQGTTINDSSGNGNTGTWSGSGGSNTAPGTCSTAGTAWGDGAIGKRNSSLEFDGTDDVVRIPESASTDVGATTDSYSVSAWFKTSFNYTAYGTIVGKDVDNTGARPFGLYIEFNLNDQLSWFVDDGAGNIPFLTYAKSVTDGNWHHAVGVRDAVNDLVLLYVDGQLVGSTTDTTTTSAANNDDLSIGNSGASYTSNDFVGQIDDARIYRYALTASQVKSLYNQGAVNYGPVTGAP